MKESSRAEQSRARKILLEQKSTVYEASEPLYTHKLSYSIKFNILLYAHVTDIIRVPSVKSSLLFLHNFFQSKKLKSSLIHLIFVGKNHIRFVKKGKPMTHFKLILSL